MSDKADQSAGPIIEAFGGIRPMAAKLGAPVSTVQGWKQRGTIPAGRMAEIRNVAAQHDITLPPPGENTPDENGADRPVATPAATTSDTVGHDDSPSRSGVTAASPAISSSSGQKTEPRTDGRSAGGLATGLSVLALLVALGGAGWVWWTTEGPGVDGVENSRLSALEGRVARLAEGTASDPGKAVREALAGQIESLRGELETFSAPDLDSVVDPLRAELAELAGQVRQIGTGSDGAGGPALAQRLDELAAELQTIADQATQNVEKISGGLADLTSRLDMLEAREDALKEQFTGFAREDAQDEAAALAAIRISLLANRLRTASERGVPYADVLTALEGVAKDDPVLSGLVVRLAPHADSGVATLDALQFAFPETTVAILDNAPADAENDIVDEILDRARRVVRVRRVGTDLPADSVDGRIARAERRLNAGDVAGAVTVLEEFEGPARAAAEPWLERARAHADLQAALQALDDHLLTRLAGAGGAQ